ncbi:MAG: hypothetical protein ACHQJD_07930 [Thermoanaerobaculia bacterium]
MREGLIDGRRAAVIAAAILGVALCEQEAFGAPPQGGGETAERMSARALVANASERAATKLRRPECQEVLSDFRDAGGRRLSLVLEDRGLSANAFLASLVFVDGRATPLCATGRAAAGANPGSVFIGVCKETFARIAREDPGLAANAIIHEMLHALGLGENPPTSEEITRQVVKRCGF